VTRQFQSRDQVNQIFTNQTNLITEFETFNIPHEVVTSLEYTYEDEENFGRSATVAPGLADPFNPNPWDNPGSYAHNGAVAKAGTHNAGISVFDTVKITEQWLLNLGVRVDYYDSVYDNRTAAGTETNFSTNDFQPTWRTGLTYKPQPCGSI